jgi:hypothetical protein
MSLNSLVQGNIVLLLASFAIYSTPVFYNVTGEGEYSTNGENITFELNGTMQIEEPTVVDNGSWITFEYEITAFDFTIEDEHYTGTGNLYPHVYKYEQMAIVDEFDPLALSGSNGFFMASGNTCAVFYHEDGTPYYASVSSYAPYDPVAALEYSILPDRVVCDPYYGYELSFSGMEGYLRSWEWDKISCVPEPSILLLMVTLLLLSPLYLFISRKKSDL